MKGDSVQLLTNTRGLPWTKDGFRTAKALGGRLKVPLN